LLLQLENKSYTFFSSGKRLIVKLRLPQPEDAGAAAGAVSVLGEVGAMSFDGEAGGRGAAAAFFFGAAAAPPEKNDAMDFCMRMRGASRRTEESVEDAGFGVETDIN
jgi:hypothetical protein